MTGAGEAAGRIVRRVEDGVGWITIDNVGKRNAISHEMWPQLAEAADAHGRDPAVGVVVLHGAGGRAFASGADIGQFDALRASAAQEAAYRRQGRIGRDALAALDKPLLAMVEGFCIGGGLALALLADMRLCTPESTFGIPAARLGVAYAVEPVERLTRLVGPSRAKDILFTGRRLPAAEALSIGLVDRIVAADGIAAATAALAREIAVNAPLSVRASKGIVDESLRDPAHRDEARIARLYDACFDSADYAEGRRAFLEKRAPRFEGR